MPNWKKVIVSGSDAAVANLTASGNFLTAGTIYLDSSTSPRDVIFSYNNTAAWQDGRISGATVELRSASTRRVYINSTGVQLSGSIGVNGNTIITGSASIGTSSLGPFENTLTLGARDNASEGGQIGFNAPGGTYASASFIDNWQNKYRILKGTNAGSSALIAQWDIHTTQLQLPAYTSATSFVGTATANLAVDSGGNVITVSTSGGSVFPYTGNAVITGSLTTTGIIYAQPNGGMYFQGGDDAALYDINVANTMGVYGMQDSTIGSIKLGSGGGTISGKSSNIGINTTNPTSASLTIGGNVWATSLTGSLLGTASTASYYNGTIPNTQLANSSITIGTTAISLGGTSTTLAGLSAVVVTGSLKVVNGSTNVIDTSAGRLYDVYGNASVNFATNQLLNYWGANVVNWGSNFLLSNNATSATTMSINWESRYLADTAGTQRLKWTTSGVQVTGSLISTGGFTGSLQGTASWASNVTTALTASSITPLNQTVKITGSLVVSGSVATYGAFNISDIYNVPSADFGIARILRDGSGTLTLDYANQKLYAAGVNTLDWRNTRLYSNLSGPASLSVDWDNRWLYSIDNAGTAWKTVKWNDLGLYDLSGVGSIGWGARRLYDDSGQMSIHYGARALGDAQGYSTFQWDATSAGQRHANQSYYYLRTQVDQTTQEEFTRVDSYTFQPEGRILQGVKYNGYVNNFDFVYLDNATGEWSPVDKVSTRATKMLGIAFSVGQDDCVLLEGHVQVNGANTADCPLVSGIAHGLPIYVSHSSGATTTVPTNTGDYVRIIGHAYFNSTNATDYWTMNFRPDHAWVEL